MKMSQMNQTKVDFHNKLCNFFHSLEIDFNGKNLCVCLSGGADSVSLLSAMTAIREKFGFNLFACHFNHMIRGAEADSDEEFCKKLCKKINVKIFCGRDDVPAYAKLYKQSIEEAARTCRYAFFDRISKNNKIDYCLTAHNMNDDAETLLFNLIRGSGINGATSISPVKNNILRPMLDFKRSEIEEYLAALDQDYVVDNTNNSIEYTRNYIRKVLMPVIEEINPSAVDTLSRYINSARDDRDYFENVVENLSVEDLRDIQKSLRSRIIYKKYCDTIGCAPNYSIMNTLDTALYSEHRLIIPLPKDFEAIVGKGKLEFFRKEEIDNMEFDTTELKEGENILFGERVNVHIDSNEKNYSGNFNKISTSDVLSFDNINGVLHVRNRRIGDKIRIHGVNKSVKKLFIDKKIPKEYRNIIPVIFDDEGILYIPFIGISDRAYCNVAVSAKKITTTLNSVKTERWNNAYEKEKQR